MWLRAEIQEGSKASSLLLQFVRQAVTFFFILPAGFSYEFSHNLEDKTIDCVDFFFFFFVMVLEEFVFANVDSF